LGKPAIAISQYIRQSPVAWDVSRASASGVLRNLLEREPPQPGSFWNVNLPDSQQFTAPTHSFCPLDTSALPMQFEEHEGKLHYRGKYHDRIRTPGSDIDVCFGGGISITAIGLATRVRPDGRPMAADPD
jgi:5'-nucleotidase